MTNKNMLLMGTASYCPYMQQPRMTQKAQHCFNHGDDMGGPI